MIDHNPKLAWNMLKVKTATEHLHEFPIEGGIRVKFLYVVTKKGVLLLLLVREKIYLYRMKLTYRA